MPPTQHSLKPTGLYSFLVILTLLLRILPSASAEAPSPGLNITQSWQEQDTSDDIRDGGETAQYEASFPHVDRRILGRQAIATQAATAMENNAPQTAQFLPNTTLLYSFQAVATPTPTATPQIRDEVIWHHDLLRREEDYEQPTALEDDVSQQDSDEEYPTQLVERQTPVGQKIWVSINTCWQPNFSNPPDQANPPQLTMLYRTTEGPGSDEWASMALSEGFASFSLTTSSAVLIQIVSPPSAILGNHPWRFDLVASRDAPYHALDDTTDISLKLIDSDPHAALLITDGLSNWTTIQTNQSMAHLDFGPPFGVFANNFNFTGINGLRSSYCALTEVGQIQGAVNANVDANRGVEMGLTEAQPSNVLEEQFYLPGLNGSTLYYGRLATINGTYRDPSIGGGGVLFPLMNFTTKHDENCAVVYNLSFCNEVNYAVPANPSRYSTQDLAALYDNTTAQLYQNFSWSIQQVACNTTPSSQYSLAVTCDDCRRAYKSWLCAVTIPKCEDFSTNYNASFLSWDGAPSAQPSASTVNTASGVFGSSMSSSKATSASEFHNDLPSASPQPSNVAVNYLMPRNLAQKALPNNTNPPITDQLQLQWTATNSSRNNATIAGLVQPGPYMEVLPCNDLCYDLVRMCPAVLQFSCPEPGSWLESYNYGRRGVGKDGAYTCNAPGAVYYPNAAARPGTGLWLILAMMALYVMI